MRDTTEYCGINEAFVKLNNGNIDIICSTNLVVDPKGTLRMVVPSLGQNSFIYIQFLAEILQNNRLAQPRPELASPSGKSWIRHLYSVLSLSTNKSVTETPK